MSTSGDFLQWSEPKEILTPDAQDPADLQWYNNTGFVCGSQYHGLIEAYYPATTDTIDIQLIRSRGGTNWERCFDRSPFIANGEFDREWDWGCIYVAGSPPVRVGDELYFYYSGFGMRHETPYKLTVPKRNNPSCRGIGLATLRLDGFVSLHSGSAGGRVLTALVRIEGDSLQVNAQCRGELRVEILDEHQRPIPGFALEECQALTRDSVSSTVKWKGSSLSSLRGKSVHLHFQLQDVDLYSYWSI